MTIHQGKVHEYLGIKLDYCNEGKVKIDMTDYLKKILNDLPSKYQGRAITPAAKHLFEVNNTTRKLSEKDAQAFHTTVEKLLFLCKRERPDILTGVAFLTIRVREPYEDDDKKLSKILKYLIRTRDLVLTLESDDTGRVKCWVDAEFAVHHDMKSHKCGMISMGRGALYSTSNKQKLNTKSSTKAELVGVYDLMPQILWMRYFLEAQSMKVSDNIVYQDNQSAMKLEKNGRVSSGKQTRHININYFFVTDHIQANEMKVEYCPMEIMIVEFYMKPLQGKLFRLFRNLILNLREEDIRNITLSDKLTQMETKTEDDDRAIAAESAQECVGENKAGSLNTGNRDVGSDDIKQTMETREIIESVKPDLLS